jgi:hypothetical protein
MVERLRDTADALAGPLLIFGLVGGIVFGVAFVADAQRWVLVTIAVVAAPGWLAWLLSALVVWLVVMLAFLALPFVLMWEIGKPVFRLAGIRPREWTELDWIFWRRLNWTWIPLNRVTEDDYGAAIERFAVAIRKYGLERYGLKWTGEDEPRAAPWWLRDH